MIDEDDRIFYDTAKFCNKTSCYGINIMYSERKGGGKDKY